MLAIVIPYFKKSYFKECLESLANQTNKNFTVYIGDDASCEDPLDLIEESKDQLDITYKRFKNNLGGISLTKQWERCIELTRDEKWLMILGDDDYISENYVEEFYKYLPEINEYNIKVIRFASRIIRSPSGTISIKYTHPKIEKSTDSLYRRYFESSRSSLSEYIFERSAFLKNGFRKFPLGWGADNFAWLDFTNFGSIYTINTSVAYFRISELNISRGGYKQLQKQNARIENFSLIVYQYLPKFERYQRLKFICLFEQIIYNAKSITLEFWWNISALLLKDRFFLQFLKFQRRFFIKILNSQHRSQIPNILKVFIKNLRLKLYRVYRMFVRFREDYNKTEFERRIWRRQKYMMHLHANFDVRKFKMSSKDSFERWKEIAFWQRRLENKYNAKQFVKKLGVQVADILWTGKLEEFNPLILDDLPDNYIIKPVFGEASKSVYLMKNGTNLFDNKQYSKKELTNQIIKLFESNINTELIIEEFLPNKNGEYLVPNDYRFYTFNGEILWIQLDKRTGFVKDQVSFYTPHWDLINHKILEDASIDVYDPAPKCLDQMKDAAIKLSREYKIFCRIDFYATENGAVFGEFTPTPRKGKFVTTYGNRELIRAWDSYCKDMI